MGIAVVFMKLAGKVKDFMTSKYPVIRAKTPICKVVGKIESFMVVMDEDEIVGMLTEMDILRTIRNSDSPSQLTAGHCMSPCKLTGDNACMQISEERPAEEALQIMTTGDVSHLLVFDKTKKITGVISVNSLLKAIKECKLI